MGKNKIFALLIMDQLESMVDYLLFLYSDTRIIYVTYVISCVRYFLMIKIFSLIPGLNKILKL